MCFFNKCQVSLSLFVREQEQPPTGDLYSEHRDSHMLLLLICAAAINLKLLTCWRKTLLVSEGLTCIVHISNKRFSKQPGMKGYLFFSTAYLFNIADTCMMQSWEFYHVYFFCPRHLQVAKAKLVPA